MSGGGSSGSSKGRDPPAANGPAMCANCLHPADRHVGDWTAGGGCSVEIAVTFSDGPDTCPCERCVAQGTACSVDGCGEKAVHYRVDSSGQIARDMCARHYKEAEPYCERYYDLTGSPRPESMGRCAVDGCDGEGVNYVLGRDHVRYDLCIEHLAERPYGERYYEITGGRPFPEGTPCGVDGCGGKAVQAIGGAGSGRGRGPLNVCAEHYGEAAPASAPAGGGGP